MKIETKRLIMHPFSLLDVDSVYAYASDPLVAGSAGFLRSSNLASTLMAVNEMSLERDNFVVVLKKTNTMIESITLMNRVTDPTIDTNFQCEVGYVLNQTYWGNAYIPEALLAILDYCFDDLKLHLVWVGHADFNNNSKRVIEKIGFTYQSNFDLIMNNHIYFYYVMTKSQWFSRKMHPNN